MQQAHAREDAASNAGAKFLNPIGKAAMRNPAVFGRLMMLAIIGLPVFRDCVGR